MTDSMPECVYVWPLLDQHWSSHFPHVHKWWRCAASVTMATTTVSV